VKGSRSAPALLDGISKATDDTELNVIFRSGFGKAGLLNEVYMTREEIEKRMEELARKYVETHDKEIIEELYRLGRELEKMEKLES
jgi:FKBP-type peptidyl-prolyl cis-trans isomerase (trigger factor)